MKNTLSIFFILLVFIYADVHCYAQAGNVNTVAGMWWGISSPSEGVSATFATFNASGGIGLDRAKNVYISDTSLNKVRRVDAIYGLIYTVVGNGTVGFSGDGGPATAARLKHPAGIYIDGADNIFIADQGNSRIRKVSSSTGIITTIAGGGASLADGIPATNAAIKPSCVYVDAAGNIYTGGINTVRKISPSGIITTIAGNGTATNSGDGGPATAAGIPGIIRDITMDASGNMYIVPGTSDVVRKIDAATGIITTVAGGGSSLSENILATNALLGDVYSCGVDHSNNLIIADNGRQLMRQVDFTTGEIRTIAGGCGGISDDIPALTARVDNYRLIVDDGNAIYYTNNGSIVRKVNYSSTDILSIPLGSMTVGINMLCAGPEITVYVPTYVPSMTVKTYFGDGKSSITPVILSSCGSGYAVINHFYDYSGTYTIKQVLHVGATPVDSFISSCTYNICRSIFLDFYHDLNSSCEKDSVETAYRSSLLIEVDSNGVIVDTLSATSGTYYNQKGNFGDFYKYKVLNINAIESFTCPTAGIATDTFYTAIYNRKNLKYGIACYSSGYDLIIDPISIRTGIHTHRCSFTLRNSLCDVTSAIVTAAITPKYSYIPSFHIKPPGSLSGNLITWFFPSVPIDSPLTFGYSAEAPMSSAIVFGDTVQDHISVTPVSGDIDPESNAIVIIDTVRSSFDPNMISVSPAGYIDAGTQLEYTIQFENTGNDTAFNIYVLDTLSDNVDFSSFRVLFGSAPMITTRENMSGHHVLKFDFPHINLLDSSHHGLCHGAVRYTVKTKADLPIGTIIDNKASIYFDYNEPVVTNTVRNIIGKPVSVDVVAKANELAIFPNPVSGILTIQCADNSYHSFTITNAVGQQVAANDISGAQSTVDVHSLASGLYYITVRGNNGNTVRKFVKE